VFTAGYIISHTRPFSRPRVLNFQRFVASSTSYWLIFHLPRRNWILSQNFRLRHWTGTSCIPGWTCIGAANDLSNWASHPDRQIEPLSTRFLLFYAYFKPGFFEQHIIQYNHPFIYSTDILTIVILSTINYTFTTSNSWRNILFVSRFLAATSSANWFNNIGPGVCKLALTTDDNIKT
jgi:hypothetical protein